MRALLGMVFLNPIVLFAVALTCGPIGIVLVLDAPAYANRLERAEQLPPSSAAEVAASPAGREVLLEGRISPHNPVGFHGFVAYMHEEYRDEAFDGDTLQRWVEVNRAMPQLHITVSGGDVRIANDDYVFDKVAVTKTIAEPTATKGAVQVRGFKVGSPVLVIGRVVEGGAVEAEFLFGGSRADYFAEMRGAGSRTLPGGLAFLAVAVVAVAVGVREIRAFLREVAAEQAAEEAMIPVPAGGPRRKRRSRR